MRKYYRPSHCIKSNAAKKDWKGNEALRCAVQQPTTMLSMDQPDQTTCMREQFGKKSYNLASLDLARKNKYLIPEDC